MPRERVKAIFLLVLVFFTALVDVIGIASILPFMTVLTNPVLIETNFLLNYLFKLSKMIGANNIEEFLSLLGFLVFVILIFSLSLKAITSYTQVRFVQMREFTLGKRLIEGYLKQPYSWFLSRHSAELGKTILSEVQAVIIYGIKPLVELTASIVLTIALFTLLFIADPKLTLLITFSLICAYSLIFLLFRKYLNRIGKIRLENNELRFKTITEAFGAAKEIKVSGIEKNYTKSFSNYAKSYAIAHASSLIIAQLPRFLLEIVAFGGVLLMILYLIGQEGSFSNAIPIISLYVFAGYRLLPALQLVYASLTQLTYVGPSLDKIYEDLKNLPSTFHNVDNANFSFKESIILNDIEYTYPSSSKKILNKANLKIPAKSTVGLIGTTGSGKTTTIDIILGLLNPQKGELKVDGKLITNSNVKSWQKIIGYVPQHIYLSDDTIAANIAFVDSQKDIKMDFIEKVSKIANLHDFVKELPNKYQTKIGERGVRLSGGQRQRIGIARALYHNPQILILDEATSALDSKTEELVIDKLANLRKDVTIIFIAHRLNTLKNCDMIFKFENEQITLLNNY